MANYQLTGENWVLRISDHARIPFHDENPDYAEFLAWVAAGNEPLPVPSEVMVEKAKAARAAEVDAIVVTTASGKTFDGDEKSQDRMSRAINAMDDSDTTLWVLADNTPTYVTRAELREALRLAGEAQTEIWVRPYL